MDYGRAQAERFSSDEELLLDEPPDEVPPDDVSLEELDDEESVAGVPVSVLEADVP